MDSNDKSEKSLNTLLEEWNPDEEVLTKLEQLLIDNKSKEPVKRPFFSLRVKKLATIFLIAILSSVVFELIFLIYSYVFTDRIEESIFKILMSNGVWFYYGLLFLLIRKIYKILKDKYDFSSMFKQKIIFSLAISILSWILNFNQNITSYFGNILMLDDIEYESDDVDYDPYGGSSSGGYIGEYIFYIPIDKFVDGKFQKDEMEFLFDGDDVSLKRHEDVYDLNTKRILFWEYAYCESYESLIEQQEVESKGIFSRMLTITPMYFLELFINKGVKGIAFALYILVIVVWYKDIITKKKDMKMS